MSNLKKSTTVSNIECDASAAGVGSSSESDEEDGVAPGMNLAKMLRNVSNTAASTGSGGSGYVPPGGVALFPPVPPNSFVPLKKSDLVASSGATSDGEQSASASSRGNVDSILKNPAVARRRRQNEG